MDIPMFSDSHPPSNSTVPIASAAASNVGSPRPYAPSPINQISLAYIKRHAIKRVKSAKDECNIELQTVIRAINNYEERLNIRKTKKETETKHTTAPLQGFKVLVQSLKRVKPSFHGSQWTPLTTSGSSEEPTVSDLATQQPHLFARHEDSSDNTMNIDDLPYTGNPIGPMAESGSPPRRYRESSPLCIAPPTSSLHQLMSHNWGWIASVFGADPRQVSPFHGVISQALTSGHIHRFLTSHSKLAEASFQAYNEQHAHTSFSPKVGEGWSSSHLGSSKLAVDPLLSAFHHLTSLCTDIIEISATTLTFLPKMGADLVRKVQLIGRTWDDHPNWYGWTWYTTVLLAVAALARVVKWFDAEREFWNLEGGEEEDEAAPFNFFFDRELDGDGSDHASRRHADTESKSPLDGVRNPLAMDEEIRDQIPSVPPSSSKPAPSSIKDFDIIKPISKGIFGSVFLAKRKSTGEYFAIKVLQKANMLAKNQITNLKADRIILMKQADSPFVVKLYFTFQSKDNLYFVMDYLNGGDCAALIRALGSLPEELVLRYVAEILLGLEFLHEKGIAHRDMRPENILIDQNGHLRLTDFGLRRVGLLARQTREPRRLPRKLPDEEQEVMGTPDYLAPELILGLSEDDRGADWWAIGVITYEFLYGAPPFHAETQDKVFENILSMRVNLYEEWTEFSRKFCDFMERLLVHDPSKRLGINGTKEVKDHPLFDPIEWDQVMQQEIQLPRVRDPESTDYNLRGAIPQMFQGDKALVCLIAEDNPISAKILETLLVRLGCHCIMVTDGAEAISTAHGNIKFDLILMDHHMPVVDGEPAARYIKSTNNLNKNTPIVAVSAYVGEDSSVTSNLFAAYIAKPVYTTDLLAILHQLFPQVLTSEGSKATQHKESVAIGGIRLQAGSSLGSPSKPHAASGARKPLRDAIVSPAEDDFGTFSFKNLPILKQANDEVIRKLKSEQTKPATHVLRDTAVSHHQRHNISRKIKRSPVVPSDFELKDNTNPSSPSASISSMASSPSQESMSHLHVGKMVRSRGVDHDRNFAVHATLPTYNSDYSNPLKRSRSPSLEYFGDIQREKRLKTNDGSTPSTSKQHSNPRKVPKQHSKPLAKRGRGKRKKGSSSGSGELSYAESRGSPSSFAGSGSDSNSGSFHATRAEYMARPSTQSSLEQIFASVERSFNSRQNHSRNASLSSR
ncbi:hypothetical protein M408DRAFT_26090 [Serendipita vermifera MAFF 305830]|uniref:non-specific serine/threonine protein kinase n=1 Tax=Serendipita vermifera MAFF 305830 TaxID=933852 RepID=A0A0C2WGK9_SERVB|nr:hypothetical protein M408DRAFT_26090 [Serendipita vermifera MAFF 305830]